MPYYREFIPLALPPFAMDEKATAFARRLAAYSATAGVALSCAPEATAQIVHTLPPDCDASMSQCTLDFDQDGDPELRITYFSNFAAAYGLGGPDERVGAIAHSYRRRENTYFTFDPLSVGYRIGNDRAWYARPPSQLFLLSNNYFACPTNYIKGTYFHGVALTFDGDEDRTHFGWFKVERGLGDNQRCFLIIKEFAYEMTPGGSIEAGQTQRLYRIGGDAAPATFTPEGGTLLYTTVLTNDSDEDVTQDVWYVLSRGRGGSHITTPPALLDSPTVPAGSSIDRTYSVEIASGLPPGRYVATFHLGTFSSQTVSAQGFVIRVQTVTHSEPGVPAGYALTATAPNPTTERARFTLEVARTQAVRITVHDALGRTVTALHEGILPAGVAHPFTFEGSSLPQGVYAVRVVGEDFADVRTLTLTR